MEPATEPVKIYVMVDPDKKHGCKVGVTKNEHQRIKAFKTSSPNAKMLKVWDVPSREHERQIHDLLRDVFTSKGEWFYGHPSLVVNIIDGYLIDNDLV
jgi:hypothetical protein